MNEYESFTGWITSPAAGYCRRNPDGTRYDWSAERAESESERVLVLEAAIRALLNAVNARHPDQNPREWTCPHMAELDRLVRS
jgi:hypothetical protein